MKDENKTKAELIKELKTLRKERGESALNDITERKQVEEKEKEHHKNIQLLSKTAMQFVEFPADKNLYNFIGEQLKELIGKDSYIVINTFDEETSISTIRAVLGVGKFTNKITKLLGRHPVGMTFYVEDTNQHYTDGKMHLYEEGLYGLLLKTIPKILCKSMEKLLNIKKLYIIDLAKQGQFFGSVIIFLKEGAGELKNKQIIEAFIKQASIALQRRLAEEAQRQSEEKYRTLYESSRDAIMMLTPGEGFLSGNPAAVKLFGCKNEKEFTSLTLQNLSPRYQSDGTLSSEKDKQIMAIAMEKGSHSFEWTHKRLDGKEFPATVLLTRMELQGRRMLQATVRDITERKRAEMEIRLLLKLTMAISEAPDFETALNTALSLTCEHTGWVMGEVWVPNHNETALEYCLGWCDDRNENNERLSRFIHLSKQFTFPLGVGLPGRVWQSMQPEWQNDVASLSEEIYLRAKPSKEAGLKAALGVPIISNGQVLTVLVFYMTTPQQKDERQIKLVSAVTVQLGTVILRKKAEEELTRMSNAVRVSTDSIVISDLEGTIIDVNEATLKMYGTDDKGGLIGKNSSDLIAHEDREEALVTMQEEVMEKGYVKDQEYHVVTKDGSRIPVEMSASIMKGVDGEPIGFVGITRDITERKRAEEKLKDSEEHLKILFDYAPDAYYVHDSKGNFVDGNKAAEKVIGYKKEELIGKSFLKLKLISISDIPKAAKLLAKTVMGLPTGPDEFVLNRKDNSKVIVEILSYPVKIKGRTLTLGLARDITERKQAEENLKKAKDELQMITDSVPAIIFYKDTEGRIIRANKALADRLKMSVKDIVGKTTEELFPKEQAEKMRKDDREVIVSGKPKRDIIEPYDTPEGTRWAITDKMPYKDKEGKITGVISLSKDITIQRKSEQKLQQTYQRLKKTMDAAIDTMSKIIEAKDPYTFSHQHRVCQLAVPLAQELGLAEDKVEGIRIASLIHDIGKIGLPTEILSKPSKLTDIEFGLIKGHSQIGYDILKSIDFSYPIARIVLQHHERLNSSGYPNNLKGDEIILEAKVIGVADVVEAMSSFRPYRPALGIDVALEEIIQNKGTLYDPEVVDACLRLFKEKGFKFE